MSRCWLMASLMFEKEATKVADILALSRFQITEADVARSLEMAAGAGAWSLLDDEHFSYLFKTGASLSDRSLTPVLLPEKMVE